jgi:hypothetical protein
MFIIKLLLAKSLPQRSFFYQNGRKGTANQPDDKPVAET